MPRALPKPKTKTCRRCGVAQPLSHFAQDPSQPDGRDTWDKACKAEYDKLRRQAASAPDADRLLLLEFQRLVAIEDAIRWCEAQAERDGGRPDKDWLPGGRRRRAYFAGRALVDPEDPALPDLLAKVAGGAGDDE